MKTLIVYYTLEGNTHYAAKKIAAKLGADVLRIKPVKSYPRKGFKKFSGVGRALSWLKRRNLSRTNSMLPHMTGLFSGSLCGQEI